MFNPSTIPNVKLDDPNTTGIINSAKNRKRKNNKRKNRKMKNRKK